MNKKDLFKRDLPDFPNCDIAVDCNTFYYTAESENDLLVINMFLNKKLVFRTFLNSDDFVSQVFLNGTTKISNAKFDNIKYVDFFDHYPKTYNLKPVNNAADIIYKHCQKNHWETNIKNLNYNYKSYREKYSISISELIVYQEDIRKMALKKRHDKIRNSINDRMLEIKPIKNKDFNNWIYKNIIEHCIFFEKGENTGICSSCHKAVNVKKVIHNKTYICPKCHKKVKILNNAYFRSGGTKKRNNEYIWYIQKVKNGFCFRLFEIHTAFTKVNHDGLTFNKPFAIADIFKITNNWELAVSTFEIGRYFYNNEFNNRESYEWGNFYNTNEYRWCKYSSNYNIVGYVYPKSAKRLNLVDSLKYMPISDFVKQTQTRPFSIIEQCLKYPFVEYTHKLGLSNLTAEILFNKNYWAENWKKYINCDGKNIVEILGCQKKYLKELIKLNPTAREIYLFNWVKKNKKSNVDDLKKLLSDLDIPTKKLLTCLNYQSVEKYIKYINIQAKQLELNESGFNDTTAKRYIANDYYDYIIDCQNLGYNLKDTAILNPYDLREAHTSADTEQKCKTYLDEGLPYAEIIKEQAKNLEFLMFENEKYIIRPIETLEELVDESRYLNHCVGSYSHQYAEKTSNIFCIRKIDTPNKPLCTLELNKNLDEIVQCRGFKNSIPTDEIKEFYNTWLNNHVLKKIKKAKIA